MTYSIFKRKNQILNECFRIFFLLLIVIFASFPHFGPALMTPSVDAQTYFFMISDFLTQLRNGIFPTYINQTAFFPMAIPILPRAPYIFFLSGLVDLVTAQTLGYGAILNFTLIFSIFLATFGIYFLLLKLNSTLRWEAALLAALYILSPGVAGMIYVWTMYFSAMTLPFVPLVFYGLIRSFRTPDYLAAVVIGMSLAFLWMSHPPIAFCCTAIVLSLQLFYLLKVRTVNTLKIILVASSIFILLDLFYFISIFEIGANTTSTRYSLNMIFQFTDAQFVRETMANLRLYFYDVIYPTNADNFRVIKLGSSLWLLFIISMILGWRKSVYYQRILIGCCIFICLLLLPVPGITQFIWSHLPKIFEIISEVPGYRLYICFAALGIFTSFTIYEHAQPKFKKILLLVSLSGVVWSIWELHYPLKDEFFQITHTYTRQAYRDYTKTISLPENERPYTMKYYLSPDSDNFFDPFFENRIVSETGKVLQSAELILAEKCRASSTSSRYVAKMSPGDFIKGPSYNLSPDKHYFLSFLFNSQTPEWTIIFKGNHFYREYSANQKSFSQNKPNVISLWHSENKNKKIDISAVSHCPNGSKNCNLSLNHLCFQEYNPMGDEFPIRLLSIAPYRALLNSIKNDSYLETHRAYIKNYAVTVNGIPTPYSMSSRGMVLIPIKSGSSLVEINFKYTTAMIISFIISALGWVLVFAYLAHKKKQQGA